MRHQALEHAESCDAMKRPPLVPWFVIGFVAIMLLRTLGDAMFDSMPMQTASAWRSGVDFGQHISELLLTGALTAVGLSVSFKQM